MLAISGRLVLRAAQRSRASPRVLAASTSLLRSTCARDFTSHSAAVSLLDRDGLAVRKATPQVAVRTMPSASVVDDSEQWMMMGVKQEEQTRVLDGDEFARACAKVLKLVEVPALAGDAGDEVHDDDNAILDCSSVIKKRRKKMNKHKLRKRRRRDRHKKKKR